MIKNFIPLITPFDKKYNVDFLSLEKLILFISNIKGINYIIIFNEYSEYYSLYNNDKIDIINCIQNNNINNINLVLKINNKYYNSDIIYILNKKIYKNIKYIIIDYPNIKSIFINEILNNYNKIFKYFKNIYFFINFNNNKYINEKILLKIKLNNKNFLGIIIKENYLIKNYSFFKNIKIIINNDLILINKYIDLKYYYGIISPLFNIIFEFINNIIYNYNNKMIYNKKINNFEKLINIIYNKINIISGIKYLLNIKNICNFYIKLPCNNINNIKYYKKLKKIYNILTI
ncbi:MAG: hypothetical protein RDO_0640 [Flavobacteriales endosymbiont of Rhyzopertha dominica]|nr:MAG: hypothetical protein NHG05_00960 [Candidatus Shikimatogenerans bostrichidophilus]